MAGNNDTKLEKPPIWTPEAQARLQEVPEGLMRELTRQRVEKLARQRGESTVTLDLLQEKYRQWRDGSAQATNEMTWTNEAEERMARVPAFVRGMVVKAVEAYAEQHGLAQITLSTVDEAKGFWGKANQFHHP